MLTDEYFRPQMFNQKGTLPNGALLDLSLYRNGKQNFKMILDLQKHSDLPHNLIDNLEKHSGPSPTI